LEWRKLGWAVGAESSLGSRKTSSGTIADFEPNKLHAVESDMVFDTATGLSFPKQWFTAAQIIPNRVGPDVIGELDSHISDEQ
jgi:hypothetical protein